jgi:hypothetical protein
MCRRGQLPSQARRHAPTWYRSRRINSPSCSRCATTGTLIQLLLSQGVITRDKAEEVMQRGQLGPLPAGVGMAPPSAKPGEQGAPAKPGEEAAQGPKSEAGVVCIPYVPQLVKDQIPRSGQGGGDRQAEG